MRLRGVKSLRCFCASDVLVPASTCEQGAIIRWSSTSSTYKSVLPKEAEKFSKLSQSWWDSNGPFGPLLRLNPTRCQFIRDAVGQAKGLDFQRRELFKGLNMLDVGCGGGILSESLSRMGANVLGIDITAENVRAATEHSSGDPSISARVRYQCITAEELSKQGEQFDVVIASEVLEHVRRPDRFMQLLAQMTHHAPAGGGPGLVVVSTLNRTLQSYLGAIVGAEYLTGMVPAGTHEWQRFITPQELAIMASAAGLQLKMVAGMSMNPLTGRWWLSDDLSINYIALLAKTTPQLTSGISTEGLIPPADADAAATDAGVIGSI